MSYHRFNNLAELLNGDIATKIGQGILSRDLMDRECNYSLPNLFNRTCAYKGKFRREKKTYKVKCSMCEDIYVGNTQLTFKRKVDVCF